MLKHHILQDRKPQCRTPATEHTTTSPNAPTPTAEHSGCIDTIVIHFNSIV